MTQPTANRGQFKVGQPSIRKTHGMSRTPTWNTWVNIVQRITNPNYSDFSSYGGRGLDIDPRWRRFEHFLADMGLKPAGRDVSIGRIENNRGYWPDNCRWETAKQQASNRRNTILLTYQNRTQTVAEWSRELGILDKTIYLRLSKRNCSAEIALRPVGASL